MERIANFIANEFDEPASRDYLDVIEPATGGVYARVPMSDAEDVNRAAATARAAFPAWASTPAAERSRLLLRLADLIEANLEQLAQAESRNCGKPIALARGVDIPRSAANMRYFATAILHAPGEFHETDQPAVGGPLHAINYTLRRPRGVAGLISPWNLPLYLLTWKIAPAVATGNTCVAKPSEVTPMTAHLLAGLVREAGFPPGVINIVHGDGRTCGSAIVQHAEVPAVSFTGSTAVGRWIGETCGRMLKRVSLELGGKNAFVIFDDADLGQAIPTAVRAAFTNQGQVCLCGSRLLVQRRVFERVLDAVATGARALVVGDPRDEATQFGSLTSRAHFEKVAAMVDEARAAGGVIHCGGAPVPGVSLPARCRGGYFYQPTVISGLDPACRVEREEIFGPVVTVQPFEDEDQAAALANGTDYGLAASVFTGDVSRAHRFAERVQAGVVWVNCWLVRDLRTPFGGMKASGVGREGGLEALRFFTEPKNVCVKV
ncbi:MAG: 5-carboxy-2-hydroxymuconate semialdehyde dehydrogenase [Phycisphaerae bacterium]|nr:MAG: 5-carboxy-2-hydroxymuconate semialdehyde dehydrogenase [Phycisphaerae bacterium]